MLEHPIAMILGPDETVTASVSETAREFRERTEEYWASFVRSLSIPFEWQEPVIRAAITLKLCSYDDSGAILAAMTTSVPEAPYSGRNRDYRHGWLRDAYFAVYALNRLGTTESLEHYLSYITNLAFAAPDGYGSVVLAAMHAFYDLRLQRQGSERLFEQARDLFEVTPTLRNPVGLFSADIDPRTGELWGHFPQTYSMVGLVNSVMRLSRDWSEAY